MNIQHKALCALLCLLAACGGATNEDYTQYVNCFVGTDGPGNTYPGAVVPFGMVQLSPDNGLPGWDRIAGYYWPDSTIAGFSHKHLSGTGAGDLYDVLIMPFNSRFTEDLWPEQADYRPYSLFSHEKETASPGYYAVDLLSSGIKAELTTTARVGMHRYTYPQDDSSRLLIDLGYHLNWDKPLETFLRQEDEYTIVGYRFSTGWAADQREHFVIKSSKALPVLNMYAENVPIRGTEARGEKVKCEAVFSTRKGEELLLKVALSSHSIEGARKNLEAELPAWSFDKVATLARRRWNKQLESIRVEGTLAKKRIFYTNLYHCFLTPSLHSDVDGAYKGADGEYHRAVGYDKYDTFSLWDTYRTAHPLYTILCPDKVEDFIASFLSHYDETGLLPVWSFAGNETNMMIGYHAVPVMVDAYCKGITMDVEKAYEACCQTARSEAWDLPAYKKLGYVPSSKNEETWSVSKTLEYAYDDWCIARFAQALERKEDYKCFIKRSKNWQHLYDAQSTFIRPRNEDGSFVSPFRAKDYSGDFCESNAWHYFWHLPHDIEALIATLGQEAFVVKLDSMFSYAPKEEDALPLFSTGMIGQYAHGNEPSHHVAYLYNYVGMPEKTQELVHKIIETQYADTPDGYCGNEDCGQMSAWLVMSSLGLYPVNPADGIYHLTKPWLEHATIELPNGKSLAIINKSFGDTISRISFNGTDIRDYKIRHKALMQGGELVFW